MSNRLQYNDGRTLEAGRDQSYEIIADSLLYESTGIKKSPRPQSMRRTEEVFLGGSPRG